MLSMQALDCREHYSDETAEVNEPFTSVVCSISQHAVGLSVNL